MTKIWQAETYNAGGNLSDIDFPERETAEEAIADAIEALSREGVTSAAAVEWECDGEGGKTNTGNLHEVTRGWESSTASTELVLWGRRDGGPWLKLTNNTSSAEMKRREKDGWKVVRLPVGVDANE